LSFGKKPDDASLLDEPQPILNRVAELTRTAMADDAVQQSLIRSGFEPIVDSGPEPAQQTVADELARWVPIMKSTGFKME
jgi:tripartite-type tricarboxylate transporter receptor subunit TctC